MADRGIQIAAILSLGIGRGNAEIVAIPQEPAAFRKAVKYTGWLVREDTCFHLTGEDRAGALADTLDRIAQEGINLQAVYAMGLEGKYSAYFWCDEKDLETIRKILKE